MKWWLVFWALAFLYVVLLAILPNKPVLRVTALMLIPAAALVGLFLCSIVLFSIFNFCSSHWLRRPDMSLWAWFYLPGFKRYEVPDAELTDQWLQLTADTTSLRPLAGWRFGWNKPENGVLGVEAQDPAGLRLLVMDRRAGMPVAWAAGLFWRTSDHEIHRGALRGLHLFWRMDHAWRPAEDSEPSSIDQRGINAEVTRWRCTQCSAEEAIVRTDSVHFAVHPAIDEGEVQIANHKLFGLCLIKQAEHH